ncbi:MAG: hypothetical protein LBG73_09140 [Spirochaetaceae bacterium]|jgi:hypothetical protein|nr:hypothetical protein [Spirochaetaceae bacterium]
MKRNSFIAGILSAALIFQTGSCISLTDKSISASEETRLEILGKVSDAFASMQWFHIASQDGLKKRAYEKLLAKAQKEYGPDVDVRNITMKGKFSIWQVVFPLAATALGAGIGALTGIAVDAINDKNYQDMRNDGGNPDREPTVIPLFTGIFGGAFFGGSLIAGNFQTIICEGEVVSGPGGAAVPRTSSTAVSNPKGTGKEGVYIGIISFANTAEDLSNGRPIYLDESGKKELLDILDKKYAKAGVQGTALYYAAHKALANLTANVSNFPANLDTVNTIIFTDGLDNNSTNPGQPILERQDFGDKPRGEYLTYVQTQLETRKIGSKDIVSYSVGLMGNDINQNDKPTFTSNMEKLASKTGKYYPIENVNALNQAFGQITEKLVLYQINTDFKVLTTGYSSGTKLRMTFDVPKARGNDGALATNSQKYLQGEVSRVNGKYVLTNITYGGLSSSAGQSVEGIQDKSLQIVYTFTGLEGVDPKLLENKDWLKENVRQWAIEPGQSNWQANSEYAPDGTVETKAEKKSAVIYLVLDCSTSLPDADVIQIRKSAIDFVNMVYDKLPKD